jgi:hypothetical protein
MYDTGTDFVGLLQGLIQAFGAWYSLAQLIAWVLSLLAVASAGSRQVSGSSIAQHDPPVGALAGPGQVSGASTTEASTTEASTTEASATEVSATEGNLTSLPEVALAGPSRNFGVSVTRPNRPPASSREDSGTFNRLRTPTTATSTRSRSVSTASSRRQNPSATEDEELPLWNK